MAVLALILFLIKARRKHNAVSQSTISSPFPLILNMFQRLWQKEQNAIISYEASLQNGGIHSPEGRESSSQARIVQGSERTLNYALICSEL
jgi:hypothetical protein